MHNLSYLRFIISLAVFIVALPVYAQEPAAMPRHDDSQQEMDNDSGGAPAAPQAPQAAPQDTSNKDNFQVDEDESPDAETPEEKPQPAAKSKTSAPAPVIAPATGGNEAATGFEMAPQKNYADIVVLQALNKITARASELVVPVGSSIRFGNLEITAHLCWKSSPEDTPDSKALLEVDEQKPDEDKKKIFYGWMLASSPALSSLEHPVYDITVVSCRFKPANPTAPAPATVPAASPTKKAP